ncbi:MAG: isocitrate/isopropylmalate family dehydrogenase [Pirellulaceae bacterium]
MTENTYRIALYPGDGIGPDVTREAVRLLKELPGVSFHFEEFPWGLEYWKQHSQVVPDDYLDLLADFDAILLGAVGWPLELPDHVTLAPLVRIRQAFDQYACVRPARLYPGLKSVLAEKGTDEIDLVVIRENSEGEYIDNGGRFKQGGMEEVAVQTALHTRKGVERILRFSFEMARTRRGKMTMITKSNAQRYSYVMWDDIWEEIRGEYQDVESSKQHCDAAVMNFVRQPESFDVVVASNLFGDLLTDLGGILSGGLGLAPSCNINPEREFPSMFEPVHGSAPDIAGQGIANPVAAVLSAAMMLDHLDEPESAGRVRQAVEKTLLGGQGTPDLGGDLSTSQMGDLLISHLE